MFKKPNIKANVWKDQKGIYGLAMVKSWKLFESCRVHIITFTTTQMFLLVEKKYPLTHFTLKQMLNNVKLEVEEDSEMSLELLRLIRKQLNEGCTRPDVAFVQNITSRFQHNSGKEHWTAVKNILKYLRNTKYMFLTGYVFILNGGVVNWKSTKQSIFATSSSDAEYIDAFDASKEVVWIRIHLWAWKLIRLKRDKSDQNRTKTGSVTKLGKSRAVSVDRARKNEENAKRMVKNANT
nr:hypothetical protein [Tanacetum cinerariifolium]